MEDLSTKYSLNVVDAKSSAGAAGGSTSGAGGVAATTNAAGVVAAAAAVAAAAGVGVSCGRSTTLPLNYVSEDSHLEHAGDSCGVEASMASSSNHTNSWLAALHVRNNNNFSNDNSDNNNSKSYHNNNNMINSMKKVSQNGEAKIALPESVLNPPLEQRCTHKSQSVWECFTCSCQTISMAKMKHTLAETNGACSLNNRDTTPYNGAGGDAGDLMGAAAVEDLSSASNMFGYGIDGARGGGGGGMATRDNSVSSLLPLGDDYDDNAPRHNAVGVDEEDDDGAYDECGAVSLSHMRHYQHQTHPHYSHHFHHHQHHHAGYNDEEEEGEAAATGVTAVDIRLKSDRGHRIEADDDEDAFSNRTSLNNSTENLSYTSDNFYSDEVLLLGNEAGTTGDAEELSLNSDDCVYAYRGEGADFDLSTQKLPGRNRGYGGASSTNGADEETDYLEMDFEPDPSSELEYNTQHSTHSMVPGMQPSLTLHPGLITASDINFLKQRGIGVNIGVGAGVDNSSRQATFPSPTDNLPMTRKALQNQSLLTKNFARMNLHLDQIQKDYCDEHADVLRERLNSISEGGQTNRLVHDIDHNIDDGMDDENDRNDDKQKDATLPLPLISSTSSINVHPAFKDKLTHHSLPNVPHEHFLGRSLQNTKDSATLNTKEMHLVQQQPLSNQMLMTTQQLYKITTAMTATRNSTAIATGIAATTTTTSSSSLSSAASKMTGAKPKRLSTFSSTSSTSSKNSSKSRASLKSSFNHPMTLSGNSNNNNHNHHHSHSHHSNHHNYINSTMTMNNNNCNFDERSASCNEFRSDYDLPPSMSRNLPMAPHTAPSTGTINMTPSYNMNSDDICLDCLEKEFLATTIGKTLDPTKDCVRCRKRLGNLLTHNHHHQNNYYHHHHLHLHHYHYHYHHHHHVHLPQQQKQQEQQQQQQQHASNIQLHNSIGGNHSLLRHSISPASSYFMNMEQTSPTSKLFPFERLHLHQDSQPGDWDVYPDENPYEIQEVYSPLSRSNQSLQQHPFVKQDFKLQKEVKPPDNATVTIPTKDFNELCLIQAMDKMKTPYNREILLRYFKKNDSSPAIACGVEANTIYQKKSSMMPVSPPKDFRNLLHFILHVSKSQCNYSKLKGLVEKSTNNKLTIRFKADETNKQNSEMVAVKVSDILHQWSRCKDLEVLKKLDERFINHNIIGKIANIVRQAHQRCTTPRRPMPESISIPSFYPNGFLILTHIHNAKCLDGER